MGVLTSSGVEIWFDELGDADGQPVLLVMGQGGQATAWDSEFCDALTAHGYRVVRFDNRDAGLSGECADVEYTIADMASDAVNVLDAVGVRSAHVVGQSMGAWSRNNSPLIIPIGSGRWHCCRPLPI